MYSWQKSHLGNKKSENVSEISAVIYLAFKWQFVGKQAYELIHTTNILISPDSKKLQKRH